MILPIRDEQDQLPLSSAKICHSCGYLHSIVQDPGPDTCERCGVLLPGATRNLFRMQNVITRRADRISSDEEERTRQGYEIITAVRFNEHEGTTQAVRCDVLDGENVLGVFYFGPAATIWRINRGWSRRDKKNEIGFLLDIDSGRWATNPKDEEEPESPVGPRLERVIPYVEDRRNTLIFEPAGVLDDTVMATLQAALKNAIQVVFQLEDSELAAEALPAPDDRRMILFYEASEGGAGVLRRIVEDLRMLGRVTREALSLCHFDPDTGKDKRHSARAMEDCEAACYDCLMSYTNQLDHQLLDRQLVKELLMDLMHAQVAGSPVSSSRREHFGRLSALAGSQLEKQWLTFLYENDLNLPTGAQVLIEDCGTRPDFEYAEHQTVVYIDGPHHDFSDRQKRDAEKDDCVEDMGMRIIRFGHSDDWGSIIERYASIFGGMK